MAMGTRKQREKQEEIWIAHTELASAPGLSFAKILWCREINSLYSFLNPCICYNLGQVPLLATLIRSLGS
ncbi:MAG: hypothetical protein WCA27_09840, partial [Candidatus Sulfotelmatobacter sp.]